MEGPLSKVEMGHFLPLKGLRCVCPFIKYPGNMFNVNIYFIVPWRLELVSMIVLRVRTTIEAAYYINRIVSVPLSIHIIELLRICFISH